MTTLIVLFRQMTNSPHFFFLERRKIFAEVVFYTYLAERGMVKIIIWLEKNKTISTSKGSKI